MKAQEIRLIIVAAVVSLIASMLTYNVMQPSDHQRIYDYYHTVNVAEISPHVLIERVKGGENITIVDVRDPAAYAASHIQGAINIPADDEQLIEKFKALDTHNPIVTYCYTEDCMASRQVGKILSENGIYAQHLNV